MNAPNDSPPPRAPSLATLGHDLRNPLAAILVGARLLERRLPQDAPEQRTIDAIRRAAEEIDRRIRAFVAGERALDDAG